MSDSLDVAFWFCYPISPTEIEIGKCIILNKVGGVPLIRSKHIETGVSYQFVQIYAGAIVTSLIDICC